METKVVKIRRASDTPLPRSIGTLILGALVLAGCATPAQSTAVTGKVAQAAQRPTISSGSAQPLPTDAGLLFVRAAEPSTGVRQALAFGVLEPVDGCLGIRSGTDRHVIIWPVTAALTRNDAGRLAVTDRETRATVGLGDPIELTGGVALRRQLRPSTLAAVPARCPEPFWVVGDFRPQTRAPQ